MKKIYGMGINDYNYSLRENGKKIKSYNVWRHMLMRCYDEKYQEKYPTYIGCIVCDEWLYFSNFKKWFDENYRWDLEERGIRLELDKDLLSEGNKIYSPKTCVFLPQTVNSFLANKKSDNKSGYTGVSWKKQCSKWSVSINDSITHVRKHVGYFNDLEEASRKYIYSRIIEMEKLKQYMKELGYNDNIIERLNFKVY